MVIQNYSIKRNKYRKSKKLKISNIFDKKLVLSIMCDNSGSKDEKISKEKESFEILKLLD